MVRLVINIKPVLFANLLRLSDVKCLLTLVYDIWVKEVLLIRKVGSGKIRK